MTALALHITSTCSHPLVLIAALASTAPPRPPRPLRRAEVFKNATVAETETALLNRTVQSVLRKGKYFWFTLSGEGPDILFHFGMTGYLAVKGHGAAKYVKIKEDAEWPPRFLKLELTFDDGTVVAFMDARRCGLHYAPAFYRT